MKKILYIFKILCITFLSFITITSILLLLSKIDNIDFLAFIFLLASPILHFFLFSYLLSFINKKEKIINNVYYFLGSNIFFGSTIYLLIRHRHFLYNNTARFLPLDGIGLYPACCDLFLTGKMFYILTLSATVLLVAIGSFRSLYNISKAHKKES